MKMILTLVASLMLFSASASAQCANGQCRVRVRAPLIRSAPAPTIRYAPLQNRVVVRIPVQRTVRTPQPAPQPTYQGFFRRLFRR